MSSTVMAQTYYAEIDANGIVLRVIVADQSFINSGAVGNPDNWVQSWPDGGSRMNPAAQGYNYNKTKNRFETKQPYSSWLIDDTTGKWKAPKPYPNNPNKLYRWDESVQDWVEYQKATGP